jgi:plastocyanin
MYKAFIYGLILTVQSMSIVGCQRFPSATQSGAVKEIFVWAYFSPAKSSVNTGDEVRWTNKQLTPISIMFPQSVQIKLSCRNNFEGFYNGGIERTLGPNESASLCFHSSVSQYDVRMHSGMPEGQVNVAGSIRVRESSGTDLSQPAIRYGDQFSAGRQSTQIGDWRILYKVKRTRCRC